MTNWTTRRRARLVLAALAAAALAAASAATASASGHDHAGSPGLDCGWDSVSLLTGAAQLARGFDGAREPNLNTAAEEVPADKRGKGGKSFSARVPVWIHVISDGATGALPNSAIQQQINVLNTTFGGFEGGVATGFSFRLAGVTRTDSAEWFWAPAGGKDERDMKKALRRGGAETLNVYTTAGGGYLGWAYFPSTYKTQPYLDGVVLHYGSLPGGPFGERFSLGETLTHEAGHWLGLYHTFDGGCSARGDYVDDTPPMKVPTSGCPEGKDTCSQPGLDPIHNYMDYSWDSCYSEFSAGQASRMQDQWLFFRADGGSTATG